MVCIDRCGQERPVHRGPRDGSFLMTQFSTDDQWRSFQTFVAAYLAGMLHPHDVFTISRRAKVSPPLVEFRCETNGVLRFSVGDRARSDDAGDFIRVRRDDANQVARRTVELLRAPIPHGGLHRPSDRGRRRRGRRHRGRSPRGWGPGVRCHEARADITPAVSHSGRQHPQGAGDTPWGQRRLDAGLDVRIVGHRGVSPDMRGIVDRWTEEGGNL